MHLAALPALPASLAFAAAPDGRAGVPFLLRLKQDWLTDLETFLHVGLPKLIAIVILVWILIALVNLVTRRVLALAERKGESNPARAAQIRTLATVLRGSGIGIVLFFAILQALQNVLRFNLGPLLASAGIAGVAIGLAAQTIVKDVLNGILILAEDQYNVGDVVTLAGMTGTVEDVTLRKTTVRGFDGTLYVIPNSQITNVANQNRGYSQTTLNISVDFSADPDKVVALLRQVTGSVRNDPAYRNVFLADPQVLGVDSIKGSEVIYPITVKTLARRQFDALREMQRRIRLALEENNMLPGSPYRVLGQSVAPGPGAKSASIAADPTTARPNEINPFTGEGM